MVSAGTRPARVAVIGAGGIGKHHAKWWALEGAEVCAIAGTSPESVARAADGLRSLFPFDGRLYSDVARMLEEARSDIVDICSPPPLHAEHARAALMAGCGVLCEKPFVYDPAKPPDQLLQEARDLVTLAEARHLPFSVCTQYACAARIFDTMWRRRDNAPITHYVGQIEAPAKNRPPDPWRTWADLSPHPIGVLLKIAPEVEIVWDTVRTYFEGYEATAIFDVASASETIHCGIVTRNRVDATNVRHFEYNGYPFTIEGDTDERHVYCSRIETPDGAAIEPDLIRLLIRDFLAGRPSVDMAESVKNLEWMLRLMQVARTK